MIGDIRIMICIAVRTRPVGEFALVAHKRSYVHIADTPYPGPFIETTPDCVYERS